MDQTIHAPGGPSFHDRGALALVIPARIASTRLPGKPLRLIGDRPMIAWVVAQALKVTQAVKVLVATDDDRIARAAEQAGASAVMTDPDLPSGTDRCLAGLEAAGLRPDLVVNLQGDEPFVDPSHIETLLLALAQSRDGLATLATPTYDAELIQSPDTAKIALGTGGEALYFSRYGIPFRRDGQMGEGQGPPAYIHHGIYGYRFETLKRVVALPVSLLEEAERLEQLRWLEAGLAIQVGLVGGRPLSVDTPDDLARAQAYAAQLTSTHRA